jgi:hypothetical protein
MLLAMKITFNTSDDNLYNINHAFETGQDNKELGQSLRGCLGMWKDIEYQNFASFRKAA